MDEEWEEGEQRDRYIEKGCVTLMNNRRKGRNNTQSKGRSCLWELNGRGELAIIKINEWTKSERKGNSKAGRGRVLRIREGERRGM